MKYFIIEENRPIFTNDSTQLEVNETNWTYENNKPIDGCLKWDESLKKVVKDEVMQKVADLWDLKAKRDEDIYKPLNGFDVDEKALRNIQEVVANFDRGYPTGKALWIMADNSVKEVTKVELESLLEQFLLRKLQIFQEYIAKKEQYV